MTQAVEPPVAQIVADVTCRTSGCLNAGVAFRVVLAANDVEPTYRAHCVGCDTPITDIQEVQDA